jgi:hypothetical protein
VPEETVLIPKKLRRRELVQAMKPVKGMISF